MKHLVLILFSLSVCACAEYNFTEKIQAKCKPYICDRGYVYSDFFRVTGGHRSADMKFEMHLAIKGNHNGHILLSPIPHPGMNEPVYEIVVGAGSNTFSELRRMKMKRGKTTVTTVNILKATEYVPFWVKVTKDGSVSFGKEGEDMPILFYKDPQPLEVNYFSFANWDQSISKVLYDCPYGENITDESEIVVEELSPVARLKEDLFKNYDKYIEPPLGNVFSPLMFYYRILSVKFDVIKGVLYVGAEILMTWKDERLQWNPKKYNDTRRLTLKYGQIWKPDFMIYDSLKLSDFGYQESATIIDERGVVTAGITLSTKTMCIPGPKLVHWPKDEHNCTLRLGLWSRQLASELVISNEWKPNATVFMGEKKFRNLEWDLIAHKINGEYTNYSPYVQLIDDDIDNFNTINIKLTLRRKYGMYSVTLYSPFIWSSLVVLISFWVTASPGVKTSMLCLNLITIFYFLSSVIDKIPPYTQAIPNLVVFYMCTIYGICFCICMNVLAVWLKTEPRPFAVIHSDLKRFLISSPITNALGLPELKWYINLRMAKFKKSMTYEILFVTELFVSRLLPESYQQLEEENTTVKQDDEQIWDMLILAIERITFILYTISMSTLIFINY